MVIAEADQLLLEFTAAHGLVEARQAAALLEVESAAAVRGLDELAESGLLGRECGGTDAPVWFRITGAGLQTIGSCLPVPGFDPRPEHALGVGWLWLAARGGTFGSVERVLSERQMRAEDLRHGPEAPFEVRLREFGGDTDTHYPDLVLLMEAGRVVAELALTAPRPGELEAAIRAYAADARIAAVLVFVENPPVGQLVQSIAARLELTPFVHVQMARAT